MRAPTITIMALAGALVLGACSQKTQDAAGATLNSAGNDISATAAEGSAAADNATANSGATLDHIGNSIGNAADATANATGNALDATGNAMSNAADGVRR